MFAYPEISHTSDFVIHGAFFFDTVSDEIIRVQTWFSHYEQSLYQFVPERPRRRGILITGWKLFIYFSGVCAGSLS